MNNMIVDRNNISAVINFMPFRHNYRNLFPGYYERNDTTADLLNYSYTTNFLRIIFVLIARLGFLLIQVRTIPIENVYKIFFYNILEIAISVISYAVIGYALSFGVVTWNGFIGYSDFFNYNMDYLIFGFSTVLLGTAQISSFIIGRVHIAASMITTFLYSSAFQPMLMHWIWHDQGWMNRSRLMDKNVSVKDHGGSLVVHLSSTLIGFTGAIFLGRRLMKVDELDEHSVGHWNTGSTIIGYVFVIFGYIAYSLPTPMYEIKREPDNYMAIIIINNTMALAIGMMMLCLLHVAFFWKLEGKIFNYWTILRCLQGGIAGLISVSAAVDIYYVWYSAAASAFAATIFFFFSFSIQNTFIEDHCNLTASHLICSIIGITVCPLLTNKENFHMYKDIHTLWQLFCTSIVLAVSVIFAVVLFLFFVLLNLLRSEEEQRNHHRAAVLQKFMPRNSFMDRLLAMDYSTELIAPGEIKKYKDTLSKIEDEEEQEEETRPSTSRQDNVVENIETMETFNRETFTNINIVPEHDVHVPLRSVFPLIRAERRKVSVHNSTYIETIKENLCIKN